MFEEMAKALENTKRKQCFMSIVYTSGENFCAGMDLNKMKTT